LIMYLEANDVKIEDIMEELNNRKKWVTIIIIFLQKY
jgi:phosphoribosyl-ATP pyrophosphohydrolase